VASIDRLKEEIGWLKVPFGVLVVVDASLLGWLAQSYAEVSPVLVFAGGVATVAIAGAVFWINRVAYRRMKSIEEG
jgi:hypothetical protein